MAGFKTHITTSSLLGVGGAVAGWHWLDVPWPTATLGGCLCSVAGMLPDLDSNSGVPRRESVAFAAAVVPMLLAGRLNHFELPPESIVLAGAALYLFIRFGLGWMLEKFSDHRGMFHSIPAMLIFGELTFLLCYSADVRLRCYLAGATMAGFASHLILDELWAIDFRYGIPRFKKSFGTALKCWSDSPWANFSTYAKLGLLSYVLVNDPNWMQQWELDHRPVQDIADRVIHRVGSAIEQRSQQRWAGAALEASASTAPAAAGGDDRILPVERR